MARLMSLVRRVPGTWNPRRAYGARRIQVGSGSGDGEGDAEGMMSEMQEKAYSTGQHEHERESSKMGDKAAKEAIQDAWDAVNNDKPQPSPHSVKQNAERVERSMNTKNNN